MRYCQVKVDTYRSRSRLPGLYNRFVNGEGDSINHSGVDWWRGVMAWIGGTPERVSAFD